MENPSKGGLIPKGQCAYRITAMGYLKLWAPKLGDLSHVVLNMALPSHVVLSMALPKTDDSFFTISPYILPTG